MAASSSNTSSPLKESVKEGKMCIPSVNEIEKQMVVLEKLSPGTASPSNEGSNNLLKKKKVRRKLHNKKPKPNITENNIQALPEHLETDNSTLTVNNSDFISYVTHLLNTMEITAITSQATGSVKRIKQKFYKPINTKFLTYLNGNKLNNLSNGGCNCNCHTRKLNNVSTTRDIDKFSANTTNIPNGIISPQKNLPNDLKLQCEDMSKLVQQPNISNRSPNKKKRPKRVKKFEKEWSFTDVTCGLQSGKLIQGVVRINAKNFREAYVSSTNGDENDYFLPTIIDRNQALEGDVVAIKLKREEEWTERLKTAYVVSIMEHIHSRTAVGFLQPFPNNDSQFAAFIPRDVRIPKMCIPIKSCPQGFLRHPNRFENILYRGRIVDWIDVKYARGELLDSLGFVGDLESETNAILAEYGLDVTPFKPDTPGIINITTDSISTVEFSYREDLRKECIFTIDPLTARDLDDAVSCKELNNGNLEVGVHISDVTHYLSENSTLDKIVRSKATTIYMVNNVYHMLPQELCLYCSLLPGKDKLAFSVFWEMTKSGEILNQRFVRTIINSCVQLSYEHAQLMIEDPNRNFKDDELPQIFGGFTQKDLSRTINYLQSIAVNLRNKRFENGSLRIDQTKLLFRIDECTGDPKDFFVYENKDAHRLIEEFMLLANISVATKIADTYPDKAFLRCHDPPKMRMLVELQKTLKNFDIDLDISSSKALQSSMLSLSQTLGSAQMAVLNHLLAKPMLRARYFCSGDDRVEDFSHYALSIPIYTHFTSPIRRYADIMVHRLLSASLKYTEEPDWNSGYVTAVANNCNEQKYKAKCAGEASSDLYLAYYIAAHQPFVRDAVVIDIKTNSFDILVQSTGSIIKIFNNALGKDIDYEGDPDNNKKFFIIFKETPDLSRVRYKVELFAIITVALRRKPKTNKLDATLVHPALGEIFRQQTIDVV